MLLCFCCVKIKCNRNEHQVAQFKTRATAPTLAWCESGKTVEDVCYSTIQCISFFLSEARMLVCLRHS